MTLQERLQEAEQAFHDLSIGKAVAELRDSNGETVRYTQASRANLSSYIADLRSQIAGCYDSLRPMRPMFR